MENNTIGFSLGPGKTEENFKFLSTNINDLRIGEYIYYTVEEDTKIVCRISEREPVNPEDKIISRINNFIGDDILDQILNDSDGYIVKARTLGVYNKEYGSFRNLRIPPEKGQEIKYCSDEFLKNIFSFSRERGILHIGDLISRQDDVKIYLNMDSIATRHLSVLASTGSGKSYTVGVILEESVKPGNRAASFVFDVHGEYHTLAEDDKMGDRFNLIDSPKIKLKDLNVEDYNVAFPKELSNVQLERLRNILDNLTVDDSNKKRMGDSTVKKHYSIEDIIDRLSDENRVDNNIKWRLRTLEDFVSLSETEETDVRNMFEPGKCNIIEFPKSAGNNERQLILWYMTRNILESRKKYMRDEGKISTPVTIFVEEAHNFAPKETKTKTQELLQEISREGRKFGVGLCVISQRPSKLDEDVLSQCNSSIVMKVRNGVDQKTISRSVESAGEDLLEDLPGLTTGQAILTGSFIQTPAIAKIRKRQTEHGGKTPNVAEESIEQYKKNKRNN